MTLPPTSTAAENRLVLFSLLAVLAIGGVVARLSYDAPRTVQSLRTIPLQPSLPDDPAIAHEVQVRFDQGVALLHAKQFEYAETALSRVVELAPNLPEGFVNLGFAILEQKRYEEAGELFNTAINLRPEQANAYWGLALALEGLKDLEGALGAMRSYIHLSTIPNDPFLPKARSALWEWEAQLGRIPGAGATPDGTPNPQSVQTPRWNEGHQPASP